MRGLLGIDNFKQLNDRLGRRAGDNALVHLLRVIKATLPDALRAVTRIKRELTRSVFLHDHQRVRVTFSAGAALVGIDEGKDRLIQPVDAAQAPRMSACSQVVERQDVTPLP